MEAKHERLLLSEPAMSSHSYSTEAGPFLIQDTTRNGSSVWSVGDLDDHAEFPLTHGSVRIGGLVQTLEYDCFRGDAVQLGELQGVLEVFSSVHTRVCM